MFGKKPGGNRLKSAPAPRAAERAAPRRRLSLSSWRDQHLYSLFSSPRPYCSRGPGRRR